MTLRECINLLFEDTANSYAKALYNNVILKTLKQSNLNQISYINFNKERINKSINAKDNILEYNNVSDFINNVLNWYKNNTNLYNNKYYINLITKAANNYYRLFKSK